ncbi:MAG: peptidylprolyl isomerase [Planctomycetota bacterium]
MSRLAEVEEATADLDFQNKTYQIQLNTSEGEIHLDLNPDVAPGHCRNLIGLTRIGYYDGLIFHRIIKGFMIQGGCPDGNGTGGPGYQIPAEFNDTPHDPGVLSMARTNQPDTAGSQFFICLGKHTHLDGSYTAFGKATESSMETVNKIGSVECGPGDRPVNDITITKATVVEL